MLGRGQCINWCYHKSKRKKSSKKGNADTPITPKSLMERGHYIPWTRLGVSLHTVQDEEQLLGAGVAHAHVIRESLRAASIASTCPIKFQCPCNFPFHCQSSRGILQLLLLKFP